MPEIVEAQLSEVGRIADDGTLDVTVITPGRGSSGYYSAKVCEAMAPLVRPGTPMYLDHPTASDEYERPGRSVKDIAATFITEGRWDGKRVHAKARLVPGPYREAIKALESTIGTSVLGDASAITEGDVNGERQRIVEGVTSIDSVDFVTRAGRGGSFRSLVESAVRESQALERGTHVLRESASLSEATASDRMDHLRDAVRSTHGEDGTRSAWVRDQDAEKKTVYFDVHDHAAGGPAKTYQQGYAVADNDAQVTLVGKPKHVRAHTRYVAVGEEPVKEDHHMPQIEESELNSLREAARQRDTLTRERDAAIRERDDARGRLAQSDARDEARTLARARCVEGNSRLPEPAVVRVVEAATATIPLDGDGRLDTTALHTAVENARKVEESYLSTLVTESGARLTGFGESAETETGGGDGTKVTEAARTTSPWNRKMEENA